MSAERKTIIKRVCLMKGIHCSVFCETREGSGCRIMLCVFDKGEKWLCVWRLGLCIQESYPQLPAVSPPEWCRSTLDASEINRLHWLPPHEIQCGTLIHLSRSIPIKKDRVQHLFQSSVTWLSRAKCFGNYNPKKSKSQQAKTTTSVDVYSNRVR